jgi:hypothetical protein
MIQMCREVIRVLPRGAQTVGLGDTPSFGGNRVILTHSPKVKFERGPGSLYGTMATAVVDVPSEKVAVSVSVLPGVNSFP